MKGSHARVWRKRMAIAGAMSALALLAIAPAFAGIGGSVVPDFQSPINVGQILTASIFITNNSTPNNDNESMKVTNIFVTPSCSAVTNGVCTGIDKDVFTIESVIGDPFDTNSTCKNLAFNVGPEDANGQFQLIPNNVSQSVTLGPSSGSTNYCNIQLNLSVNKAPVDSTPGTPNTRTTVSLAHAKMQGATTGLSATATGGSISVVTTPNLQIVKTPKEQVISAGDVASFTVLVDNTAGAGDATNVKLTDNLPNVAGLNWQINPPVAGCNVGGSNPQVLSCTTLLVPAGQSVNLIVSAQTSPAACPPMSNTAQITGYNNLTLQQPLSDTGSLSCSQGPALNKAFGPATFADGGVSTLTFTVTNPASNNPAQVVSFTDTLPTGLKIAANPNVQQTCTGGSITANAGATTITASAVTVAASTGVASSCTVKVDVTNVSGQFNGSCASFPAAFTNQGAANPPSNISGLSNLTDAVTRSCVVVNATPSLNKAFGPTTIADGGTSTLTFTVTNPASNNGAQAVSFTDALPSGLKIAATPNVQKTCTGGSVTANSGATTITVSGVTVAASTGVASSCTVKVDVTNVSGQFNGSCASFPVAFTNQGAANAPSNISGLSNLTDAVTRSCIVVNATPTLNKVFSPTSIADGGISTLTFTVTNPASNNGAQVVGFTDTLPAGLKIATTPNVQKTCTGGSVTANAGAATITVSSVTVGASTASPTTCTVSVDVTNQTGQYNGSCASFPVAFSNQGAANPPSNISGLSNLADAVTRSCVVVNATPSLNKAFSPATFADGGTSTLTFTVTNPAANNGAQVVSFIDALPSGLKIAATPNVQKTCTGGSVTANAGATTITVGGITVAASTGVASTCTVKVDVTNVIGQFNGSCASFPAAFTNQGAANPPSNISGLSNLTDAVTRSCVVVNATPSLDKAFNPTTIADGGTSTLTFTVTNPAANNGAQVVSFTDALPSGLKIAATPNVQKTCTGGSVTANAGATTIAVSGVTVAASSGVASTCTVKVDVTNVSGQFNGSCATFPTAFTNQGAANPPSNISGLSNLIDAVTRSCVIVNAKPSLNKAFSPTTFTQGGTSTLTFTMTNPAANNGAQAVSFTDTLPSGLKIAATPNVLQTCTGGSITANAGATTIAVSSVTVPGSTGVASTCTVKVDVTNQTAQFNPGCASFPVAFTNQGAANPPSNIGGLSNLTDAVTRSCVTVLPTVDLTITKTNGVTVINTGP